jgi:hypothetical protein
LAEISPEKGRLWDANSSNDVAMAIEKMVRMIRLAGAPPAPAQKAEFSPSPLARSS